jgi:single-strand DNA-binding protein
MNINKCIIAGNVTRDPELNHTTAGKSVVNFTVASTERWKSETGEQKEHTEQAGRGDCQVFQERIKDLH